MPYRDRARQLTYMHNYGVKRRLEEAERRGHVYVVEDAMWAVHSVHATLEEAVYTASRLLLHLFVHLCREPKAYPPRDARVDGECLRILSLLADDKLVLALEQWNDLVDTWYPSKQNPPYVWVERHPVPAGRAPIDPGVLGRLGRPQPTAKADPGARDTAPTAPAPAKQPDGRKDWRQQQILDAVRTAVDGEVTREALRALGPIRTIDLALYKLQRSGKLVSAGKGRYRLAPLEP